MLLSLNKLKGARRIENQITGNQYVVILDNLKGNWNSKENVLFSTKYHYQHINVKIKKVLKRKQNNFAKKRPGSYLSKVFFAFNVKL